MKISNKDLIRSPILSQEEIENAKTLWVKKVQNDSFKDDIDKMFNLTIGKSTRLSKYHLKFDDNHVLRIQGRLRRSTYLSDNSIEPQILDGDHQFTKLLVLDLHERCQHYCVQAVLNQFRKKYWMPQLTGKVQKIVNSCFLCKLKNPQPIIPSYGTLIPERFM